MKQYIDKADVVAEIERIKREECPVDSYEGRCKLLWFEQFLSFIDTLEVKGVDLEYEIDKVKKMQSNFELKTDTMIEFCAKHFFGLGVRVNNPITAADRGIVDEIIFALNALGKEKMISYDKEIKWLRNKVKKEE